MKRIEALFLLAVALLFAVSTAHAQETGTIAGTVTDSLTGDALPGVNVVIEGTTQGAATDASGRYAISGLEPAVYALRASFVGYNTKSIQGIEVAAGDTTLADVALGAATTGLNEVVVVGYGEQRRRDLTGAVSAVRPADIEAQPVTRVDEALQGRSAGVNVSRTSGAPGGDIKVRIRGANSITASNEPLYVVDGFVGADISSLNVNDIASIDILKDASATAIYGSRGSNGVVIVTTKRGEEGGQRVTFESSIGAKTVANRYDLLGPVAYAEQANAKNRALDRGPLFTQDEMEAIRQRAGTDWQDEIFRPGLTQQYALSTSGGSEDMQYYVSGSVVDDKGTVINSDYGKYTIRTNVNSTPIDRLDLGINLSAQREVGHNADNPNGLGSPIGGALGWAPVAPVRQEDGGYTQPGPQTGSIYVNPVFSALENIGDNTTTNLLATGTANLDLLESLTLTVNGSVNSISTNYNWFNPNQPGQGISSSSGGATDDQLLEWQHSENFTYNGTFGSAHRLEASAIFEQQRQSVRTNGSDAIGFTTLSLGYNGLGLANTQRVNASYTEWSLQSYIGRVNYALLDRYLFTGTVRVDGSSKFAAGNRYSTFPSAAFAWRLSEEPFMRSLETVDNLKLRVSWGVAGNQAIGPYATLATLSANANTTLDGNSAQTGVGPEAPPNPDLTWEETTQLDIGLDLSLFGDRLTASADYYNKRTEDLLLDVSVPQYVGYASVLTNVGAVRNRGFEVSIGGTPVEREAFTWDASVNLSVNRNEVLEIGDPGVDDEFIFGETFGGGLALAPTFIIKEGEPLGQIYGLEYEGVWQPDEAEEAAEYGNVPGDARYRDIDGNGNYDDLTTIGDANPDFTWGFTSSFAYQAFTLDVLVQGMQGRDILNLSRAYTFGNADVLFGTNSDVTERWSPDNPDSNVPANSSSSTLQPQSSFFVEDGSYLRLRNVTLGYNLPARWLERTFIRSARVYASGQNLITLTSYSGFDPEVTSTAGNADVNQGVDSGAYPTARTLTFGVRTSF